MAQFSSPWQLVFLGSSDHWLTYVKREPNELLSKSVIGLTVRPDEQNGRADCRDEVMGQPPPFNSETSQLGKDLPLIGGGDGQEPYLLRTVYNKDGLADGQRAIVPDQKKVEYGVENAVGLDKNEQKREAQRDDRYEELELFVFLFVFPSVQKKQIANWSSGQPIQKISISPLFFFVEDRNADASKDDLQIDSGKILAKQVSGQAFHSALKGPRTHPFSLGNVSDICFMQLRFSSTFDLMMTAGEFFAASSSSLSTEKNKALSSLMVT